MIPLFYAAIALAFFGYALMCRGLFLHHSNRS